MMNNYLKLNLVVSILILFLVEDQYEFKGGRAVGGSRGSRTGGGGFRSGSKINNIRKPFGNTNMGQNYMGASGMYRRNGIRWSSFGAGMVAYGLMSNLAMRPHFSPGYYHYYHQSGSSSSVRKSGEICINNEDFNGTSFGKFQCPLPGFELSAKYCCGDSGEQYCCNYFDDNYRKTTLIVAIISIIGLVICSVICIAQMIKKRSGFSKNWNGVPQQASQQPIFTHVNRNLYSNNNRPSNQTMANQHRPPAGQAPYPVHEQQPFIYQPNTAPYPTQNTMPQPQNVMLRNDAPPNYTDIVKL